MFVWCSCFGSNTIFYYAIFQSLFLVKCISFGPSQRPFLGEMCKVDKPSVTDGRTKNFKNEKAGCKWNIMVEWKYHGNV